MQLGHRNCRENFGQRLQKVRRWPDSDVTPPARLFALDGDGASDRPMCRRPRAALRPMLTFAVVRCAARLLPYLIFFSAAVFVFSLLSILRPPSLIVFAPERRMSEGAFSYLFSWSPS